MIYFPFLSFLVPVVVPFLLHGLVPQVFPSAKLFPAGHVALPVDDCTLSIVVPTPDPFHARIL